MYFGDAKRSARTIFPTQRSETAYFRFFCRNLPKRQPAIQLNGASPSE